MNKPILGGIVLITILYLNYVWNLLFAKVSDYTRVY